MATQKITLSLPTPLVERLKAQVPPRQRSTFVAEALQEWLEREETLAILEETSGLWSDEDYPEFATDEDIDRWLRELRASWTIPDFSKM
jgi:Arc/MetJ-type ribon-helix-helix transcriptional regulator